MGLFSKKDKYEVNEEENVPQFLYGVPGGLDNLYKSMDKEVFNAFEGGFSGPSYYYYINRFEDNYQFRFGYSKSGIRIDNDINNTSLFIIDKDKEYYDNFINELSNEVKDWNLVYQNDALDGTQWTLNFLELNKKYYGSNVFPDNYDKVSEILKKYFDVDNAMKINEKYDIKPERNVSQRVYGVPRDFFDKN
jgi:hypothetical protein